MVDVTSRDQAIMLGMKTYFTGKVCPHGHKSARYVSNHKCIDCAKDHATAYLEIQKIKYKNDPEYAERRKHKAREHYRNVRQDPDKLEQHRANRSVYMRKKRASTPSYNEKQKECIKKYRKNWSEDQKEKHRVYSKNRKAALRGSSGKFTVKDVRKILDMQNGVCAACNTDIINNFHVDHIMPIKLGGTNYPDNIQLLCPPCNLSKAAKHPDVWKHEAINRGI
jgi:hypothetical protein